MGARPLARKIDELIRVPLSKKILFDRLTDCVIHADVAADQIVFDVVANTPVEVIASVNLDGIIVVDNEN
jgi:ATP-dependent Clp protease ATP-binding subunit ClpA